MNWVHFQFPFLHHIFQILKEFISFKSFLKFQENISVNNNLIRFHTVTIYILLIGIINLSIGKYIGHSIECLSSQVDLSTQILEKYCLNEGAFSLINNQQVPASYPGVLSYSFQNTNSSNHLKYYQWVCLVLIIQALLFYLPKLTWNQTDLINLIKELNSWPLHERNIYDRIRLTQEVADTFAISSQYYFSMIYCHFFYFINLIAQIWFTDIFLSSNFLNLGYKWLQYIERYNFNQEDPLIKVFPRVVKCSFLKFGFAGTLEKKDVLCFLPLNIINEKLFIVLWFWYFALLTFTLFYIFHDLSFFFSSNIRLFHLQNQAPVVNQNFLEKISKNVFHSFVFELIAINMKPSHFQHLMTYLIKDHFDLRYNHLNKSVFGSSLLKGMFKLNLSQYHSPNKSKFNCNA